MSGEKKSVKKYINKEFWGMAVTLFSVFSLLCVITYDTVFYSIGKTWSGVILGVFGYFAFPLFVFSTLVGIMTIIGKKVIRGRGVAIAAAAGILVFAVFCILQIAITPIGGTSFGEYVSSVYTAAAGGVKGSTAGGAFYGMIDWLIVKIISPVGAYILFSLIILLSVFVIFKDKILGAAEKSDGGKEGGGAEGAYRGQKTGDGTYAPRNEFPRNDFPRNDFPRNEFSKNETSQNAGGKRTLPVSGAFEMKTASDYSKETATEKFKWLYGEEKPKNYSDEYNKNYADNLNYIKTGRKVYEEDFKKTEDTVKETDGKRTFGVYGEPENEPVIDEPSPSPDVYIPNTYDQKKPDGGNVSGGYGFDMDDDISDVLEDSSAGDDEVVDLSGGEEKPFSFDVKESDESRKTDFSAPQTETPARKPDFIRPETPEEDEEEEEPENEPVKERADDDYNPYDHMPFDFKYNAPPTSIFNVYESGENYEQLEYFKREKAMAIVDTLKALAGIDVNVVNILHGPTITRFDLDTPKDVSVKTIMKYDLDLSYRLATKSGIRLLQIPGTPYTGVEVPNDKPAVVGLRSVLESDEFKNAKRNSLTFAIGQDIVGKPVVADITKMPHLLVAGSTGTGKSVGLNALLVSLMMRYSPAELRFIIVDPKQVEFAIFKGIPHMLFDEIIFDAKKTVAMLNWAVKEMESRFNMMRLAEVRNIDEYNDQIDPRREHKMPRLVIIVDEFADLMSTEKKNIQDGIQRIAQKARAAGIYLILATQRPDAKIIEGSIKTNFTSRMAFKMSNGTDSMVVLDETGAEKLLGRGDLLYRTSSMPNVERAQGAFVDTPEIKQFVKYIIDNNKCYFNVAAQKAIDEEVNPSVETVNGKTGGSDHAVTSEYIDSLRIAVKMKVVSIALLQRKMGFGFPKAAKIFDWMVEEGYVVESQTGKQKQVVLTEEQFREKFGEL